MEWFVLHYARYDIRRSGLRLRERPILERLGMRFEFGEFIVHRRPVLEWLKLRELRQLLGVGYHVLGRPVLERVGVRHLVALTYAYALTYAPLRLLVAFFLDCPDRPDPIHSPELASHSSGVVGFPVTTEFE